MTIQMQDITAAIELLCERFPKTFFMFEQRRLPLKLRIRDDLIAVLGDAIDPRLLGAALKHYTHNLCYRASQQAGAPRIDLDGNACGVVSEADALSAAKDVASRIEAFKARKRSVPPVTVSPAPAPETPAVSPPASPPQRDGLATLRQAAKRRKQTAGDDQSCAHAAGQSEQLAAS